MYVINIKPVDMLITATMNEPTTALSDRKMNSHVIPTLEKKWVTGVSVTSHDTPHLVYQPWYDFSHLTTK
jgi:hypothetical protein